MTDRLIALNPLGTYASGVFDESAAEIVAYDPDSQRLFVVNANSGTLDVLDISDPTTPTLTGNVDFTAFGSGINSVAVKGSTLAAAVENEDSQAPGKVVLVDLNEGVPTAVDVGALPDMLTFTPDGQKILVANEGEPNDEYDNDPEGSVSIVDVSNGISEATVTTADFTAFNDQIDALRESGVRIFGPNATVAQDVEPEYITVAEDSETAWVALQENNALAVVDIEAGTISDILPLGFKDHSAPAELTTYFFDEADLPVLGTSEARGDIVLSGFSGLHFEGLNAENGNLQFLTHPDRGPDDGSRDTDGDGENDARVFLLPNFQPEVVRVELNPESGDLNVVDRIGLTDKEGEALTGRPNLDTDDGARTPIDEEGNVLPLDPLGADLEGIVAAPDRTWWMVDEYRPAIYHFESDGTLIERYVPEGLPENLGVGALPEDYNTRRDNRGFEAVAYQDGKVYAFIQTPMNNPDSRASNVIRILEFDPETESTTGQYLYLQEDMGGGSDKIGDAVSLGDGEFLVIERDSGFGPESQKVVFRISLDEATNINDLPDGTLAEGETFESLTPGRLAELGIAPVGKAPAVDLAEIGYDFTDKPEGLTLLDDGTIAVINDNDFGDGDIPIGLGLIDAPDTREDNTNGLDASNDDDAINIRNWPVFGAYQPDAIASYEVDGTTYIVTANEGDARDYDGFSEEARVGDEEIVLDPVAFPNAEELKEDEQLGRLNITTTLGDTDGDGDFDELYAYGGRSFSIWDEAGNLVFDSGNDFERITAEQLPDDFNSTNDENDSFDNRSDDKGPEPEAIELGVIDGRTFAFIGLERVGGLMVYDVTDPTLPAFVEYITTRDFSGDPEAGTAGDLGPEGIEFIAAEDSPNGKPLLAVANEVSGTTTVFEIERPTEIVPGSDGDDTLNAIDSPAFDGNRDFVFAGSGNDLVDASQAVLGSNRIYSGADNDEVLAGTNDRLFGGDGDDTLDASAGGGNNRLYGDAGADELIASEGDRLFGGLGDDTLDASSGNGGNRLYGEENNDVLFAGSDDYLLAGEGDDRLFITGGGNNVLDGGGGADQFWIANGELPASANTISDFELGRDVIGISGLDIGFAQLSLMQVDDSTVVAIAGQDVAILNGIEANALSEANFVF